MNYALLSSSSLHLMLNGIRSALAIDDSRSPGHEVYGVRLYADYRQAVRTIETALSSRREVFIPIAW